MLPLYRRIRRVENISHESNVLQIDMDINLLPRSVELSDMVLMVQWVDGVVASAASDQK